MFKVEKTGVKKKFFLFGLQIASWIRKRHLLLKANRTIDEFYGFRPDIAFWISDPHGAGGLYAKLAALNVSAKYHHIFLSIRPGDICIDCGINKGKFITACLHNGGIVHGFEPNPILAEFVKYNFRENKNVHIEQVAVSDRNGTASFAWNEDISGDEGGNIVGMDDGKTTVEKVKMIDLAEFLQTRIISDGKEVYLLKIDVEGLEFDIIPRLIESGVYKHCKYIVCETHARFFPDGKLRLEKLNEMIRQAGATNIDLGWV